MTPTPELPPYLVDAAARFDKESEACGWTSNKPMATAEYLEALEQLKAAISRAHVDIYTTVDDTTEMKEAA